MSLKREPSPGPLSTSKLSLGKLTSRQASTGSISIRFSAAAMDDDLDDDLDLTIGSSKPQEDIAKNNDKSPRDKSPKETVTIELIKNDSLSESSIPASERSKSAPPSEVSTPVSPTTQGAGAGASTERVLTRAASDASCPQEEEQRSLLAGFRERFQDKIPEPLSQLIDKFSGENSPEERERRIRKSESLDSARCNELFSADKSKKDTMSSIDKRKSHSRNASADSNVSAAEALPSSVGERLEKSSSFELVEDFYSQEPFEDFTGNTSSIGLLGAKRSSSSDQISRSVSPHKPMSKLQRLIGSLDKGSPGHRSVSMTLSGLLSNREEELEPSEDEFFDPQEQQQNDSSKETSSQVDTKPSDNSLPKDGNQASPIGRLPFQKMLAATVVLFAYLIIPLPSFVNGFCIGAVAMLGVVLFYQWWRAPPKPRETFVLPRLDELPPLRVPEMKESKNEDGKFKGWMNELYHYNPDDYHINQTHSVYVQMEGTNLRLQRSKQNVPKRAMWDERPLPTPTFVHQRHFDLVGSNVSLVPPGLVKKRLWSKKYPICVALAKTGSKVEQKLKKEGSAESEFAKGMGYEVIPEVCDDSVLFLFARTGREKEAWFRRLDAGSRGDPLPTRITDLVLPPLLPSAGATPAGTADHHHHGGSAPHPERSVSDYEVGTDVVSKLQKRHSTPNLIRQPTPPLAATPPSTSTSTTSSTSSTTTTTTTSTTSATGGGGTCPPQVGVVSSGPALTLRHRRQGSADSISSIHSEPVKDVSASSPLLPPPPPAPSELLLTEYVHFMGQVMPAVDTDDAPVSPTENGRGSRASSPTSPHPTKTKDSKEDKEKKQKKDKDGVSSGSGSITPRSSCEAHVKWINAALGRVLFDFHRETYWAEKLQERIQRKLSKIHVPYMIDELTVTDIDMGREMPFIRRISQPYIDDQGLWVDVDVAYNGGFQMSLETKVNLMKLKKTGSVSSDERSPLEKRSPVTDSEEEDSAESSTDEEGDDPAIDSQEDRAEGGKSTSRKLLRLVDKITQSKYFQQATEYKYIKRAMEEVSNTPLQLTVQLHSLSGTLAVNIPPPPTDRIWYGFRTNPKLCLVARPKVGQREVTVTHITDWIEKKLQIEFQRIFVMPNMDDLPVPLMSDNLNTNPTPPS